MPAAYFEDQCQSELAMDQERKRGGDTWVPERLRATRFEDSDLAGQYRMQGTMMIRPGWLLEFLAMPIPYKNSRPCPLV